MNKIISNKTLVIDDDIDVLEVYRALAKETKANVDFVMTASKAIDMICRNHYDIIVLDGLNGAWKIVLISVILKSAKTEVYANSSDPDINESMINRGASVLLEKDINKIFNMFATEGGD